MYESLISVLQGALTKVLTYLLAYPNKKLQTQKFAVLLQSKKCEVLNVAKV